MKTVSLSFISGAKSISMKRFHPRTQGNYIVANSLRNTSASTIKTAKVMIQRDILSKVYGQMEISFLIRLTIVIKSNV